MLDNLLSEIELHSLEEMCEKAKNVVLTCHVSPDGDAVGSMLAFYHFLNRKGKQVTAVAPNVFPDFLMWMPAADQIKVYEKHEQEIDPLIDQADLFVCLDFNSMSRAGALGECISATNAPRIMIDHHPYPSDEFQLSLSFPKMSSTCELLYRIIVQMDKGLEELTVDEAVSLYTGMMTDIGCFSYNSNRSEIYYIVGDLLKKGIDKDRIYRNVFYNYSVERYRLQGYMLYVKMETFPEYHAALMTLTQEEQKRFSHKKGDTEGFVNMPLQIKGYRLSVFLRENADTGTIRVSLRSVDDFPCNQMAAEFFNGGGHLNASGGELSCSMDEAVAIVRQALKKYAALLK